MLRCLLLMLVAGCHLIATAESDDMHSADFAAAAGGSGAGSPPCCANASGCSILCPVVHDVVALGAKADNATMNTAAFATASTAAAKTAAAGTWAEIRVAAAGVFVTGAVNVSSRTTLFVAPATTVRGVPDRSEWRQIAPLPSYGNACDGRSASGEKDSAHTRYQALVMMPPGATDVRITGGGTLDGSGAYWWALHKKDKLEAGRPHLPRSTARRAWRSDRSRSGTAAFGRAIRCTPRTSTSTMSSSRRRPTRPIRTG